MEATSRGSLPSARNSSPGWTRTNNPPVNSRMLCQLSYRGVAAAIVAGPLAASCECANLVAERGEALLELDEPIVVGVRELPLEPSLPQPEEQLLGRLLGDLLLVSQRVELGEERCQLAVGRVLPEQVSASAAV